MPASPVQLIGGNFEDAQGNLLALGYLKMKLSQDEEVNDSLICSGIEITIQLDVNGSVVTSPPQYVWGNDQMLPVNSFYQVTGYTAKGQPVFGPNNQQVLGSGGTFDVGTWVPNLVVVWVPPLQPLNVEVNGTPSSSQTILDFVDSSTVTWVNGPGGVVQAHSSASISIEENGTPTTDQTVADFTDTPSVKWSNPSGGVIEATVQPLGYLPSPDNALYLYWRPSSAGLGWDTTFDDLSVGGNNVFVPASAAHPSIAQVQNLGGANGLANVWSGTGYTFRTAVYPFTAGGTSSSVKYFGHTDFGSSPNDPTTGNCIVAGIVENLGNLGNWSLITSIGGVTHNTISSIPVVSGTRYEIRIVVAGVLASLYVNGVFACSTSTFPTAALRMTYYHQRTAGFANTEVDIEYMYSQMTLV